MLNEDGIKAKLSSCGVPDKVIPEVVNMLKEINPDLFDNQQANSVPLLSDTEDLGEKKRNERIIEASAFTVYTIEVAQDVDFAEGTTLLITIDEGDNVNVRIAPENEANAVAMEHLIGKFLVWDGDTKGVYNDHAYFKTKCDISED